MSGCFPTFRSRPSHLLQSLFQTHCHWNQQRRSGLCWYIQDLLTLSFQVWCLQPLQPLAKLEHEASSDRGKEVLGVDYSPDGSMIVTSSHGGEVVVWASKDFSRISTFHMWDRVYRVRFSVDAQYVICGGLSPVFSLAHAFVRRRPDCCLSWRQVGYCFRARVCRRWRWFRRNGSRSDSANGRYGSC